MRGGLLLCTPAHQTLTKTHGADSPSLPHFLRYPSAHVLYFVPIDSVCFTYLRPSYCTAVYSSAVGFLAWAGCRRVRRVVAWGLFCYIGAA